MRKFAQEYTADEIGQQRVDQLPWGHNIVLMYEVKDIKAREFYIQHAIKHGWSRNILSMQIETDLYSREGKAVSNFKDSLPNPKSDQAQEVFKNPYFFDFLGLGKDAHEREIEKGLVMHIERFLLEMGEGFAFMGRQYHLQIDDQDFYLDLLFYNVHLKCYVVIELKAGEFKAEYAGKMNLYLSAVDDMLKRGDDNQSIGLILCKTKMGFIAEYALKDINKPIGLAQYNLTKALPDKLKTKLPTVEEIEAELSKDFKEDGEESTK